MKKKNKVLMDKTQLVLEIEEASKRFAKDRLTQIKTLSGCESEWIRLALMVELEEFFAYGYQTGFEHTPRQQKIFSKSGNND